MRMLRATTTARYTSAQTTQPSSTVLLLTFSSVKKHDLGLSLDPFSRETADKRIMRRQIGTGIVFPLALRDNVTSLAWASCGGLCSVIYTVIIVAYQSFTLETVTVAAAEAAERAAEVAGLTEEEAVHYRSDAEPM